MKCPKCGYQRLPADSAPAWQCPSCKVAYNKVAPTPAPASAASAPAVAPKSVAPVAPIPAPKPPPSRAPRDTAELEEYEQTEREWLAARGQRILIWSILLNFLLSALSRAHAVPDLLVQSLYLAVAAWSLVGVVKICSGLAKGQNQKILFMVLSFFPLINLVTLLYLNAKTTRMLRDAGWSVGLLGARQ